MARQGATRRMSRDIGPRHRPRPLTGVRVSRPPPRRKATTECDTAMSHLLGGGVDGERDQRSLDLGAERLAALGNRRVRGVDERPRQGTVGLMVNSMQETVAVVSCVTQSLKGTPAESSGMNNPIRARTPGTTRRSTNATMIRRRTHRGPPPVCLDHEAVKLDQRASSCTRATGSSPRRCLAMVTPNLPRTGEA